MAQITRKRIDEFLAAESIAFIGVSRSKNEYSRMLFRELQKHGYRVIPVNPKAGEIEGEKCYAAVGEISPTPERAVMTLPVEATEQAVLDCAAAGVKDIWLHRHVAGGVSDTRAIFRAEEKGLNLITGFCLFMFLPRAGLVHKFHGAIMKLFGIYPK